MKENKASMTSLLSAFGRAYHSKYGENGCSKRRTDVIVFQL
ncbi:hypothetical protein ABEW96_10925 [Bacillus velezensis]